VFDAAIVIDRLQTVIDMTVPIISGTYYNGEGNQTLSILDPSQTIPITIKVYPYYQSQEPNLQGANVTLVWSNM
jgi:hypothetical protein